MSAIAPIVVKKSLIALSVEALSLRYSLLSFHPFRILADTICLLFNLNPAVENYRGAVSDYFFNHNGSEADMEELAKINPSSNDTESHG